MLAPRKRVNGSRVDRDELLRTPATYLVWQPRPLRIIITSHIMSVTLITDMAIAWINGHPAFRNLVQVTDGNSPKW